MHIPETLRPSRYFHVTAPYEPQLSGWYSDTSEGPEGPFRGPLDAEVWTAQYTALSRGVGKRKHRSTEYGSN